MLSDITNVFTTWEERVAFNSGYEKQKIASAQQAGRDAFDMGLSRTDGRLDYFESMNQAEQNEQLALEHHDELRVLESVELMESEGVSDDSLFDKSIEEANDIYADDAQWRFENGHEFINRDEWDAFIEASDASPY